MLFSTTLLDGWGTNPERATDCSVIRRLPQELMVQNRFLAMQICNADRHPPRVYGDPCPEAKAKETDRIAYLDATFSSHTPLEIADVCHLCFFAPNKSQIRRPDGTLVLHEQAITVRCARIRLLNGPCCIARSCNGTGEWRNT
jgi:hypothetical protein